MSNFKGESEASKTILDTDSTIYEKRLSRSYLECATDCVSDLDCSSVLYSQLNDGGKIVWRRYRTYRSGGLLAADKYLYGVLIESVSQ